MSCPICAKPTAPAWRPFCSRRCADIDLGNWIDGSYRVPLEEVDDVPDDPGNAETEPGAPH